MDPKEGEHYWRQNVRLIAVLLSIWAGVSLGGGILAVNFLNQFSIGQLPLGFWIAQQGSIFVFVALVFIYAWRMDHIDRAHHANEEEKAE